MEYYKGTVGKVKYQERENNKHKKDRRNWRVIVRNHENFFIKGSNEEEPK